MGNGAMGGDAELGIFCGFWVEIECPESGESGKTNTPGAAGSSAGGDDAGRRKKKKRVGILMTDIREIPRQSRERVVRRWAPLC